MLTIELETNSSGKAVETTRAVRGTLAQIVLDIDELDNTADIDIVGATTGMVIYDKDNDNTNATIALALQHKGTDGVAIASQYRSMRIDEAIEVTVNQGGDTKTAAIYLIFD